MDLSMPPSDWFIYEILLKALTSATQFRFYPLKVFLALERFGCVLSLLNLKNIQFILERAHEGYEPHPEVFKQ